MSVFTAPHFHDEDAAYKFVEARIWANGRVCPHCGTVDNSAKLKGKSTRKGVYKCYDCRKPFTVKVGTIFESSHVKLHIWLQAIFLIASSKKGISSNQLHRTLGVTLKTAWFMSHRIREAMKPGKPGPLGGAGMTIEADETYFGRRDRPSGKSTYINGMGWVSALPLMSQRKVVTLVERGGRARSFHVDRVTGKTVQNILFKNADRQSRLMTDEAGVYKRPGRQFAEHYSVNHSADEYVRGSAHTNSIEGYFSIFKRGMKGVYQHCGEQHLHRYLAEFDFRYSERAALGVDDKARADKILLGFVGKRLTYQTTNCAA